MMRIRLPVLKTRAARLWLVVVTIILFIILCGFIAAAIWYRNNLLPVSRSTTAQLFTVDDGSSARQIASGLENLGLIRSSRAFIYYIDSKNYRSKLQAGTYKLTPSMSAKIIAQKIATGDIDKNWITILPAKRLDQIKEEFVRVGYSDAEVESAFKPEKYADVPIVAQLPAGSSLEGLLYPDSFQRNSATPAQAIVRQSIEELQSKLTPDVIQGFKSQQLSTYQGIILASIVYQESGDLTFQPTVAQVFLLRLKMDMSLGSDVTAFYAAALAGQAKTINVDSPYNTRLHSGLPPGPIGNFTDSALKAVAQPSSTDYIFFVAGDDGVLHFTHSAAEHEQAIKQYCHKECS